MEGKKLVPERQMKRETESSDLTSTKKKPLNLYHVTQCRLEAPEVNKHSTQFTAV